MVSTAGKLIRLLLFLLPVPALFAGDYYISYHLYSRNFIIIDEHVYLSKAMVPFPSNSLPVCTFVTEKESFEDFAKEEEQKLLECLFEHGVFVKSYENILNFVAKKEKLELILPPTPLQVDFNDGLVIIKKVVGH
ncbi:hypothetical protein [Hydrogenimonas urashimensis]|uniref:hypothetical protein n=1 Tax=Hydrogenimonas urashimensis TaxID=2740515 RepID=UPI001915C9FC|nr:hypothetical protein [Hydrogenimonas urashimensis]